MKPTTWWIVAGLLLAVHSNAFRFPAAVGRGAQISDCCRHHRIKADGASSLACAAMQTKGSRSRSTYEPSWADHDAFNRNLQSSLQMCTSFIWAGALAGSLLLYPLAAPAVAETVPITPAAAAVEKDVEHRFLDEVLNTVEDHFLDLSNQKGVLDSSESKTFNGVSWKEIRQQLAAQELGSRDDTYAQIKKLLPKLGDKYTRFMPPSEFAKLTKYDITGVGILLIEKEGKIMLAAPPLAGSTGAEAGLQKGDRVLAIDGMDMDKKTPFEAAERLTGQAGTKVALRLARQGGSPFDVSLERRISVRNPVRTHVVTAPDGRQVGYMRMTEFNAASRKGVAEAVAELREVGVSDLVLDLRGNPGGVLEGSLQIAGLFLTETLTPSAPVPGGGVSTPGAAAGAVASSAAAPIVAAAAAPSGGGGGGGGGSVAGAAKRTLVYVMDRNGREEPVWLPAGRAPLDGATPVVVLMDRRAASASEVLAGALRDNCRAAVVGPSASFGKGLIQGAFPLSDGSGVVVTVAKYLTPKHTEIQGRGVVPDITADVGPGRAAIRSGRLDLAAAERSLAACVPPLPDDGPAGGVLPGGAGGAGGAGGRSETDRTLERLNGPKQSAQPAKSSLFTLR